jgi:cell division septum initiation protein DivIVA
MIETRGRVHDEVASVIDVLDALESMIVNGRRMPLTQNVLINEDEALDFIDRARNALPDDLKRANAIIERARELLEQAEEAGRKVYDEARTVAERTVGSAREEADRTFAGAREEADRLVSAAAERAAALVSDHAVTRAAEELGRATEAEAADAAARYRADADAYAREVLEGVEGHLERATATVHKAVEALDRTPAPTR